MSVKTGNVIVLMLLVLPCAVFARKLAPEVEHAMAYGAEAKIRLKICDDLGFAISNASVRTYFDMLPVPHSVYGKTDANGVCVVEGKTNGNKVEFFVGKEGYYGSRKEISYLLIRKEHDVKDGKWQPYGAEERIELRKIRKPRDLVTCCGSFSLPSTNVWVGFDLEKKSFVKPWGVGDFTDIEVYAEWDGLPPWKSSFCQGKLRIRGDFCGGNYVENVQESEFPYPYVAKSESEYPERCISIVNRNGTRPNLAMTKVPFRQNAALVIRTRTVLDEFGNLKFANYGRIVDFRISPDRRGLATFSISYAFNPTPNDTNLEDIETAKQARNFIRLCESP